MMRRFSLASQPGAPVDRAPVLHLCSNRRLPRSSYWRDQRRVVQPHPPSLPSKHRLPLLCTSRTPPLRALDPLPQAEVREAPPLLLCIRCSVAGSIQRLQAPKLRFITHTAPSRPRPPIPATGSTLWIWIRTSISFQIRSIRTQAEVESNAEAEVEMQTTEGCRNALAAAVGEESGGVTGWPRRRSRRLSACSCCAAAWRCRLGSASPRQQQRARRAAASRAGPIAGS